MALKKTVTTVHGFEATDAYHRAEGLSVGKKDMSFVVRSYKDASGLPAFGERVVNCEYDINGANPLVQAYEHVKALPEFSGATDC